MMSFVYVYWKVFCFKETFHPGQMYITGKPPGTDLHVLVTCKSQTWACRSFPNARVKAINSQFVGCGQLWLFIADS